MNPKQEQARDLYLQSDLTKQQIADILSIDRKTLYLWIRNNHWDKVKVAARQAPAIIQQDFYNHISAINSKIYSRDDRMPTLQEVEMLRKLYTMVKGMDDVHVGGYYQSFQDLITFIADVDRDLGKQVTGYADTYINTVLQNKDKKFHTETMYEVIERIKQDKVGEELPFDSIDDAQQENSVSDAPPADTTGNDGKLENKNITPPQINTDASQQKNDYTTSEEKFPKPDLNDDGESDGDNTPPPDKRSSNENRYQ